MAQSDSQTLTKEAIDIFGLDLAEELGFSFKTVEEELGAEGLISESDSVLNEIFPELHGVEGEDTMNNFAYARSRGAQVPLPGIGGAGELGGDGVKKGGEWNE